MNCHNELVNIVGLDVYIDTKLKVAEELLLKAKWSKSKKQQIKYLIALKKTIDDILQTLGVLYDKTY